MITLSRHNIREVSNMINGGVGILSCNILNIMVGLVGLEPTTNGL